MGKVFCFSDIHGEYNLFCQIKNFLKPTDICYVLGDVLDRGTSGIKILQEIIKDKRFKFIRGNHEQMLMDCWSDFLNGRTDLLPLLFSNGGLKTWEDFMFLEEREQCEIYSYLVHSKTIERYEDVVLTHAGYDFRLPAAQQDLIWGRAHIYSDPGGVGYGVCQVHGHTPVQTMFGESDGKILTYNQTKTCIDVGAHHTGVVALLDLDTFEEHYFERVD